MYVTSNGRLSVIKSDKMRDKHFGAHGVRQAQETKSGVSVLPLPP